MAKRNHTTTLGCIACDELSELGAGKESWLVNNPFLLSALDTHSLALSNKSLIIIFGWSNDPFNNSKTKILPELSPIHSEYISAIEWLVFDDIRVLALGTSSGYLLIYSLDGGLIHKQLLYPSRILKLRVRGTKRDIAQDISNEENMLQRWFQETQTDFWDQKRKKRDLDDFDETFERVPYQLWSVNKYGACADAAITGVMPPPLMELENVKGVIGETVAGVRRFILLYNRHSNLCALSLFTFLHRIVYILKSMIGTLASVGYSVLTEMWKFGCDDSNHTGAAFIVEQSSHRYYRAVTIGNDAVISAYRLSEDKNRSLVGALLSKVVPATFSTIASFSSLIWRSDRSLPKKSEPKPQSFARAASLTCLKDPPRKGEKLTLSPSGTLAAITDSLGRILLLDTQALVVVRLWKGYRDAHCLFMEMLVEKDSASTSYHEYKKSDYCLCLAIHAPRKGIIEVWQMRTGPRLLTIQCAKGSKILQPTYRFSSSMALTSSSSSYMPLEVFLLNGDSGQLSVINRSLH